MVAFSAMKQSFPNFGVNPLIDFMIGGMVDLLMDDGMFYEKGT